MKAVLLDPTEVGSFYNGDSYLVLDNRGETGADIHMWIGEIGATAPFLGHQGQQGGVPGANIDGAATPPTWHHWIRLREASVVSILLLPKC